MSRLRVVSWLVNLFLANNVDRSCDYAENVEVGRTHFIHNRFYPLNYPKGIQCRWNVSCPLGYNCVLDCNPHMPELEGCEMDSLLVSKSGDPQLTSADVYCGDGNFSAVSKEQRMTIGLMTSENSTGGRFSCRVHAQRANDTVDNTGTCRCGYRRENRIAGGVETLPNEFPMMAGLYEPDQETIRCGAVIISERHLLTAGHCLLGLDNDNLTVLVGYHNVENVTDSPPDAQRLRISNYTVHPNYEFSDAGEPDFDIAILTTVETIVFSDRVGPVCLPFKYQNTDLTGSFVTIAGWGLDGPTGVRSETLQKVDVEIVSLETCQMTFEDVEERHICSFTEGKDACPNDSGGPLLFTDNSTGRLFNVGVVSYGEACAEDTPAVSTRVTAYITWIMANTPSAVYCMV